MLIAFHSETLGIHLFKGLVQPGGFKVSMEPLADPAAMSTCYIDAAEASNADYEDGHSARQGVKTSYENVMLKLPTLEYHICCTTCSLLLAQGVRHIFDSNSMTECTGDW